MGGMSQFGQSGTSPWSVSLRLISVLSHEFGAVARALDASVVKMTVFTQFHLILLSHELVSLLHHVHYRGVIWYHEVLRKFSSGGGVCVEAEGHAPRDALRGGLFGA